jgi:diadenosine tetraphosphate (Ap4A) HIT family hydrolase
VVKHVHFHIINKPNKDEGLGIVWPQQQVTQDQLQGTLSKIKEKL